MSLIISKPGLFARLQVQIIMLKAEFPDQTVKSIRLDNAAEFTSQTFNVFCLSLGIKVEHHVPHVHTQNDLVVSLIK